MPCVWDLMSCRGTLQGFAVSPDDLQDIIFGSIGRTVWRDIGATAVGFRLVRFPCGFVLGCASLFESMSVGALCRMEACVVLSVNS